MGHYAKVVDGIVTKVIVANAEYFNEFVDDSPGEWIKTSYNTFGGVHYKPSDNSNTSEPSTDQSKALRKTYPTDGKSYSWNDDLYKSDNTKGWVLESVQELD